MAIQRWDLSKSTLSEWLNRTYTSAQREMVVSDTGGYVKHADHVHVVKVLADALKKIRDKGGKEFGEDYQIVQYDGEACAHIAQKALKEAGSE